MNPITLMYYSESEDMLRGLKGKACVDGRWFKCGVNPLLPKFPNACAACYILIGIRTWHL